MWKIAGRPWVFASLVLYSPIIPYHTASAHRKCEKLGLVRDCACAHLVESSGLVELRKEICRTRLPIWQESVNTVPEDGESQDFPVIA